MSPAEDDLVQHATESDRRKHPRLQVQAPALLMFGTREISAFTRDFSTFGVYFRVTAGEEPRVGDPLDFLIEVPPSVTFPHERVILGRGRAVRVDSTGYRESGVAAQILSCSMRDDITFR